MNKKYKICIVISILILTFIISSLIINADTQKSKIEYKDDFKPGLDYTEVKINKLAVGKNIIYLTVKENSKNYTKWKIAITMELVY